MVKAGSLRAGLSLCSVTRGRHHPSSRSSRYRSNAPISAADPLEDHFRKLLGLVLVGEVAAALEHSKLTAREAFMQSMGVVE
jgi:hypothetical protein